jgi:hypothetical protein
MGRPRNAPVHPHHPKETAMQQIHEGNIAEHEAKIASRKPARGSAIIHAMTETMLEHGEGCTDKDLRLAGFSQSDIDKFGQQATERATSKAKLH